MEPDYKKRCKERGLQLKLQQQLLSANTCKAGEPSTSPRAGETRIQHETAVVEMFSDKEFEKEKQEKEV